MQQNARSAPTVAVVVSMVFGLVVALLAVLGSEWLTVVALVGGVLVGVMWAVLGLTGAGRSKEPRP